MNRGEAIAILLGVAVTVAFVLWLALSAIWAKRKVPARLGSFVIDESHVHLLEAPGPALCEWKGVSEIPPEVAAAQMAGYSQLLRRMAIATPLSGWLEDWELDPADSDRGDDPWPNIPPSGDSPWAHARPWAHG